MRMFSTPEGDAGFALKGNDIVSVFKHPEAPYRNVTKSMLDLAKQNGGQRLDAFDTVLPHLYAKSGFRAVARTPWNEEYKPEGWKHEAFKEFNGGRPDVLFMVHDPQAAPYQPGDGVPISDYDEGERHQNAALAQVAARSGAPGGAMSDHIDPDHLLHWDRPLSHQSPYTQHHLAKLVEPTPETARMTGGHLHNQLAAQGEHPAHAAEQLLNVGIPGISYESDPSRTDHNHILFDKDTMGTVRKHGLVAMIHAGADALREHKRSRKR